MGNLVLYVKPKSTFPSEGGTGRARMLKQCIGAWSCHKEGKSRTLGRAIHCVQLFLQKTGGVDLWILRLYIYSFFGHRDLGGILRSLTLWKRSALLSRKNWRKRQFLTSTTRLKASDMLLEFQKVRKQRTAKSILAYFQRAWDTWFTYLSIRARWKETQCGNRLRIDTRLRLSYTQPHQKQKSDLFYLSNRTFFRFGCYLQQWFKPAKLPRNTLRLIVMTVIVHLDIRIRAALFIQLQGVRIFHGI